MVRPEVLVFLDDIKRHPTDRTPRLVLADWLEERDDARGTLVRLQWEQRSPDLTPARRLEIGELEQRLIRTHQDAWLGLLRSRVVSRAFQRGLVQLQSTPDQLVREAGQEFLASEELAWVETVRLYGDTATPGEYAATRSLQTACVLDCSWARMRGAELAGLALAVPFPYLTDLILNTCNVGPSGLAALAGSKTFPALLKLHLAGSGVDDVGLTVLADGPLRERLQILDLRNNRVGLGGIEVLAGAPGWRSLRELNLMHNQLGDEVVPVLLGSEGLNRLHVLDLRGNHFGAPALARLRERFGPRLRAAT